MAVFIEARKRRGDRKLTRSYIIQELHDPNDINSIAQFRVKSYATSRLKTKVNYKAYPNGIRDSLDEKSIHFIVKEKSGGEIAATARLTILNQIDEIPFISLFNLDFKPDSPFWFLSRLAISHEFRGKRISHLLDRVRIEYMQSYVLKEVYMICKRERLKSLENKGCRIISDVDLDKTTVYPYADNEKIYLLKGKVHELKSPI